MPSSPIIANAENQHEVTADQAAKKTVRVACYQHGDFMHRTEGGEYVGFNIDYLNKIAFYANWSLEFITYDSWEDAFAAANRGAADLLPSVYQTEERVKSLLLSSSSVSEMHTAICVLPDDDRYAYDDFAAFQNMRVGVIAETQDALAFAQYCTANKITTETIPYKKVDDLNAALESGEIDAFATSYLGRHSPYKIVARFSPEPLYIALPVGQEELLTELNNAMDSLILRQPEYFVSLNNGYFSANTTQDAIFTREEYHYMKDTPKLTVAYASLRTPLSYTDQATKSFNGISASLFADITRITGLDFEFIPMNSHKDVIDAVSAGDIDIAYAFNPEQDSSVEGIKATQPYLNSPMATIAATAPTVTASHYLRVSLFPMKSSTTEQTMKYHILKVKNIVSMQYSTVKQISPTLTFKVLITYSPNRNTVG